MTLTNKCKRGLGLPGRTRPNGDTVRPFVLAPGASRDVPGWYADAIADEPGIAALAEAGALAGVPAKSKAKAEKTEKAETKKTEPKTEK